MSKPNSVSKTPKFITLLRQFNQREQRDFKKFTKKEANDLILPMIVNELSILGVFRGNIFNATIQKKIIQKIQNSPVKKKKELNVYMGQLYKLAEQFLLWEKINNNEAFKQELLAKELLAKNQFTNVKSCINKIQKNINSVTKSFADYTLTFKVEEVKNKALLKEGLILKKDNFSELAQQLDSYYLLYKLKIFSSILSIQNITSKKSTLTTNNITSLQISNQSNPLINAYLLSNKVQEHKDKKDVKNLLSFLKTHFHQLPKEELSNFYRVVCNFYIDQMTRKDKTAKKELLNLYREIEPKELLFNEDVIQVVSLANIIALSCQIKDFLWATYIYLKYRLQVKKSERKNFEHLFNGIVSYYKGKYQEVNTHLIKIKTVNIYYKFFYRLLQIKSLYETDKPRDYKSTMAIFEAQESFFLNTPTPISKEKKMGYKNLITGLKKLYILRHRSSYKYKYQILDELEKLRKKISQQTYHADEEWLLKKLEELKDSQ